MRDEIHFGGIFFRGTVDCDEDALVIRNDVGVGEDLVFADQEPGAYASAKAAGVPWGLVIGGLRCDFDAKNGAVKL